jgi:N-ethylmaleimide reductase
MSHPDLFTPITLGNIELKNRMVMAPMTRNRATADGNVPQEMNVTYYRQRATAGLIITEATQVSPEGVGYPLTPGIHSQQQVDGWRQVTDAVHEQGGKIIIQLWFCGRISHPSLLPDNQQPVSASAIKPAGEAFTMEGLKPFETPRELSADEIKTIVSQYRHGAELAKQAGFDGIEVHAANGYLIDQFLRDGSNQRSDAYGGSVENRMRFLNEVMDAVCDVWDSASVGVRLSPENPFNDMSDSDPQRHFEFFASELSGRGLAYLHLVEGGMGGGDATVDYHAIRRCFAGNYMANLGYDKAQANKAIANGDCDLVSFGVPFLANPDLVYRFEHDLPLNEADATTFYGGDETGYIDYPFAEQESVRAAG